MGHVLAGRYRLDRLIATGGMAEVWEATDQVLTRKVAVKVLHAHLAADETFVARFRGEAIAAAKLAHPSIVSIYDTCHDGDEAIVMELVRGRTLRAYLAEHGPLEPATAVSIIAQVAEALDVAHQAGVVHRDVKPGNILLADDGRVMVADFGIAKAVASADLTTTGNVLGTPAYLAPEQVTGTGADSRTDVYALGLVLYELLCGRAPFAAETGVGTAMARLEQEPMRPRNVRAGIPRPVEEVVLRAIARAPEDRYADAGAMRAALLATGGSGAAMPRRVTAEPDRDATVVRQRASSPAPVAADSFGRSERRWLVPTALIVLVAVAIGVAGVLFSRTEQGRDLLHSDDELADTQASTVTIASADAFDPGGDGHENDDEATKAVDGDPSTAWSSEGYRTRRFGNLKAGVGLVLTLAQPVALQSLTVTSPSSGWAAEIYVADDRAGELEGWGTPVATQSGASGETTFGLGGATGAAVLVWITDLGDAPPNVHVEIAEASLAPA